MTDADPTRTTSDLPDGPAALAHAAVLASCVGYAVMVAVHRPPLARMVGGELLATPVRSELFQSLFLWSFAAASLMAAALYWGRRGRRWPSTLGELVAGLWPLTLLPVAWYTFDPSVWTASPVVLYAVSTAAVAYCFYRTRLPIPDRDRAFPRWLTRLAPRVLLAGATAAYVVYVAIHTILNHRSLGTAAFDLGIQENTVWNTLHGDFLYSSLMGSHYLGVHTSFVLLLVVPIYALAPSTEILLVLQALILGLAAVPLFFVARRVLESDWQALLVALLWLGHPAVGGANFYDFHPVAFAPLFLFTAVFFWWNQRWLPFWISIALLLSVKEELAIIVALLGIVTLMSGNRRQGVLLVIVGGVAYLILQHLVIPHFAGGPHSYAWYYADLIPKGEGPRGLVTTALLNPVFTLEYALSEPKLLYLFQLFAPLAFLPFFTARGVVLVSYGLAATLLASRPPLHQIGFQYALTLLALGFVGALLGLLRLPGDRRRRALATAAVLAGLTCFHYGMIWPRHNFTGGFHTIDFDYSDDDRQRYRELRELIAQIPEDATVLASETLVPHVARRHTVETARYALARKPMLYDYILVFNDGSAQRMRQVPYLGGLSRYDVAGRSRDFVLFRLREEGRAR